METCEGHAKGTDRNTKGADEEEESENRANLEIVSSSFQENHTRSKGSINEPGPKEIGFSRRRRRGKHWYYC